MMRSSPDGLPVQGGGLSPPAAPTRTMSESGAYLTAFSTMLAMTRSSIPGVGVDFGHVWRQVHADPAGRQYAVEGGRDHFVPAHRPDERVHRVRGNPGHVQEVAHEDVEPGPSTHRWWRAAPVPPRGCNGRWAACRPPTANLMPASGVRRSWETARRMEVRMVLLSARRRTSRRLAASCRRSSWAARCAPKAPSRRRSRPAGPGRTGPAGFRRRSASMFSPSSGPVGAVSPACRDEAPAGRARRPRSPGGAARPVKRAAPRTWNTSSACFEQSLHGVLGAERPACQIAQGGGLGTGAGGFLGAPGRNVHHGGHGCGDADEDQECEDVLRVADGQRADRR